MIFYVLSSVSLLLATVVVAVVLVLAYSPEPPEDSPYA